MATVEAPFPHRHELAEMPHWDAARGRLCYVDIDHGTINELDVATGDLQAIELTVPLGFAMPIAGSERRVCGAGNDLVVVDAIGKELGRLPIEPGLLANRINEGKPDPQGRLWFGSMSKTREPEQAALYRFDAGGLAQIRTITVGNGTDWDVERNRMYHVDSTTQRIDVFDYEVGTGEVENPRTWATVDSGDGLPDGLTIDSDGCVWLALFQGGVVRRFDPDGRRMLDIALPTPFVTCPAFGGDDLSVLFVTSSQHKIPPEERAGHPLAGALFAIEAGARGRPANLVAPAVADEVSG
jgi:sugar lactone lactonase YvrE